MKTIKFKFLLFGLLALLMSFEMVAAQTKRLISPLKREIDRSKMNRGCDGNGFSVRRAKNGNEYVGSFVLTEPFDFATAQKTALINKFKVIDNRIVGFRIMPIGEFNADFNSGAPYQNGDAPRRIGAIEVVKESDTHIQFRGRVLAFEKTVAADEIWRIDIRYELAGRDSFAQTVNVMQNGRCNLSDRYLRAKAKELLDALHLESVWTDTANIGISTIN